MFIAKVSWYYAKHGRVISFQEKQVHMHWWNRTRQKIHHHLLGIDWTKLELVEALEKYFKTVIYKVITQQQNQNRVSNRRKFAN